jgi:uncharacterized membrane protein YfcA
MHAAGWTGLASLVAGLAGGTLAGLFGVGGGMVLIPILGLTLGLDQHQAQGVALAAMLLPNGLPAVIYMKRQGIPIHAALVTALTLGFLPAVWVGAAIATRIPEPRLRLGFACVLVLLSARTLLRKRAAKELPASTRPLDWGRACGPGLVIGFAGGLASGLLGIGGAILMIPLLVWWLKLPQHEAQTTSLVLMLAPIGLPGVWVYARHGGGLPWLVLATVALGFLGGAYGGARIAVRTRGPRLRQAFAVLMAGMAALLFLKGV